MENLDSKPLLLVVDDSRLMRLAARKILRDDFEILEAGDGEQAWDSLQAEAGIHLVMSDLSMPNLDGLGLLKRIRESEHGRIKDLPVIIVTGAEDDDGSRQTALSAGASDFITKPFESVQLLARTKAQAKQQHTQQALLNSEASKAQLEQHNQIDLLTGLVNARGFDNAVEESLSFARRHDTELALLMLHVEKYKTLFLRHGKQVAENLLLSLARMLGEGRRREDIVARLDIDTFAVLLPSASAEGARRIAAQVLGNLHAQGFSAESTPPVSVTIGVSKAAITSATTAAQLLAAARESLRPSQDLVAPGAPPATPAPAVRAPMPPPAEPPVASAVELQQAVQALADNRQPATDSDALVRAMLPLLHRWNQTHGGCCSALLGELERRLSAGKRAVKPIPVDAG